MARRPPKRPIRPVIGEHFVDLRTPEDALFGEETALRPAKDMVKKPAPQKRQPKAVRVIDEMEFRRQKWEQRLKHHKRSSANI